MRPLRIAIAFSPLLLLFGGCAKSPLSNGVTLTAACSIEKLNRDAQIPWPRNRTINLVFHGHSVPAGFFKTPQVRTVDAYPSKTLALLSEKYPLAQFNAIVTARGGENSVQGASRFGDALQHQPDVVIVDYVLNDRDLSLTDSGAAISGMVERARKAGACVVLATASPDLSADADSARRLRLHSQQIREVAAKTGSLLLDEEAIFASIPRERIDDYMAQPNHPNELGHDLIASKLASLL